MAMRLRIRELIEEHNRKHPDQRLAQQDVAEQLGISPSVLSRYANGFVLGYRSDILEALMDFFEVEVNELLERVPESRR